MNSSKEHVNWITVGEVINVIKKPVALYTTHIVKRWHDTLCKNCQSFGKCRNAGTCQIKMKPGDLCPSCNGWYKELAKSHQNKDRRNIQWRKNCDTSKFPVDSWEVAKFFMPVLGDNKSTVIDAASTDLSYLLHVLTWMKDVAFAPDRRVDLNLVKDLRLVRNLWAHEPNQELTDDDFNNAFDVANKFAADLDNVFRCNEVKECIEDIKFTQTNKMSNDVEAESRAEFTRNLLRDALGADFSQLKEEVNHLKEEKSYDSHVIKEQERMLEKLVNAQQESSTRVDRFDKLFRREISEIHCKIKSLQETNNRYQQNSCIPDRPPKIFGRDAEVEKIVSLVDDGCGIVSIVGGPGFGKSTVAVEVSHRLSDRRDIVVIFSFLSNVSTVPEVIQCLCHDVGVNPGDDPKSSLIFWLKNIDKKIVLVMDNIEQLLESNVLSRFTELALTLRKNSRQQLQILTTTRTEFSISDENVQIKELDKSASVELLRNFCRNKEVKDENLFDLAKLCGFVPLALCITGSRIPRLDDPAKFIKWLREKPMKALQSTDKSQCVQKAIEFSFQMLSDEDKKALVRLSVFNGNFRSKSAEEVIERDDLETQDLLDELVARSLMQCSSDDRFMIHSLIRRYLTDHDQLQDEKSIAQELMVKHFLKMCHLWTIASYTKDGFTDAREELKKESHNVEETFKICSQDQASPIIIESMESSDIYKSSSRFFYNFGWDILPINVSKSFFKSCMKLAERREQPAIQITFQCLVADQEGRRTPWHSNEYVERMEALKTAFDKNEVVLKEDKSLYRYCYYFYARYYSNLPTNTPYPDLLEDNFGPLPNIECQTPMENSEKAFILIQRARLKKKWATKFFKSNKRKHADYMNHAELFYIQALSTAKELLGDHDLTCTCHKMLGDLYLLWRKNEEARRCYFDAIKLSRKLQLDSNEAFANLLKNYGLCFRYLYRLEESVKNLNEARDIVDTLAEKNTPCRALVYYQLAETYRAWKPDCQESAKYAKVAKEMQVLVDRRIVKSLEDIIKTAEEYTKEKTLIRSLLNIVNVTNDQQLQQNSTLPDKPLIFVGRLVEVNRIIYSLMENGCGIVSIVGGPGFGKSTVAIDVSYHISNRPDTVVVFLCLSNISTVSEVLLRLCLDVGVNPGEDPESALMFWLKNIEKKVVLVMDNIDQMLEEEARSEFTELVVSLRNNSQQQLQILTTTRTEFPIVEQTTENIPLGELDEKSSVELLRKYCPNTEVKNSYLAKLANLCSFIPLALCIAGPRIADLDDSFELIHWLEEQPAETLLISEKSQCVRKAIEFSFQKLNDDKKKTLVRLSLFNGDFQRKSAEEVIQRDEFVTQDLLKWLVARNLMQRSRDERFAIHPLIRCFLADHHKFQDEKVIAQGLMVKHFLKMCHSLTMDSFSKNGYTDARELLKTDSHNVEETLTVCCQNQAKNLNPDILEVLVNSDTYKSSSRFFYRIFRDLLSQIVLRNFQDYCINVAKNREQLPIEITFRCLVADQEGHKSGWQSREYIDMMEAVKNVLDQTKALLKEDRSLYSYCYNFYAQFHCNQAKITPCPDLEEDPAPEKNNRSPVENAQDILVLIQRAQLSKGRAMNVSRSDKEKYEEYMNCAKSFAIRALSTSQELLGDHVLTCISYKVLGDLFSSWRRNNEALLYYFDAIKLNKKLKLDPNESFVYLLKNCGSCLSFLRHYDESAEILNEARNTADIISQKHPRCRASVYCALARMHCAWKPDCKEAAKYANAAIRMEGSLESRTVKAMKDIIRRSEQHMEL